MVCFSCSRNGANGSRQTRDVTWDEKEGEGEK